MIRRNLPSFVLLAMLIAMLALSASSMVAYAQDGGPTDDEVNAIAKDLYCPVCENIPLDTCGTQACVQWRSLIRERLEQGWTEAEIKAYFVEQYGDRVLAVPPPTRGINWLVYALPPVAFLAGSVVLFRAVRNWRRAPQKRSPAEDPAEGVDDPYVAQLEQELAARKGQSQADAASDESTVKDG